VYALASFAVMLVNPRTKVVTDCMVQDADGSFTLVCSCVTILYHCCNSSFLARLVIVIVVAKQQQYFELLFLIVPPIIGKGSVFIVVVVEKIIVRECLHEFCGL